MILSVAEFRPDAPDLADATTIALNVVPMTADSYGPLPSYAPFTVNQLDAVPLGVGYGEDVSLTHHVYAGTETQLWTVFDDQTSWTDVTPAAGVNTLGENWHFAQYKELMICTDFQDPVQYQDMRAGGAFQPLSSIPPPTSTTSPTQIPNARYVAVAKDFVILANTSDPITGRNPQRVWWSGAGVPAYFPQPGSDDAQAYQSDYNDILGPQGPITGLAANLQGCDCAVFFERGVQRMNYAGPPQVFTFYPAMIQKGCIAPNSLVTLGTVCYYLGEDGFYQFDGYASMPIGATKVDNFFFTNVDRSAFDRVIGSADIDSKSIIWLFRSKAAQDAHPNMALIYRWDLQRWSVAMFPACWVNRIPISDTAALPVVNGQLQLGVIGTDLKLGFLAGAPLPAMIGTKVVQLTPDQRTFVNASRPLVEFPAGLAGLLATEDGNIITTESGIPLLLEAGLVATNLVTIALSARNNYYDSEMNAFGPDVPPDVSGDCPQRSDGRYHRALIKIQPSPWGRCTGVDVTGTKAGKR